MVQIQPRAQRGMQTSVSCVGVWRAPAGAPGSAWRVDEPNAGCSPGRGGDGDLTSPSGPGIDAAGLRAFGLLLCWLHRQWLEGGVIGLAGGLQGQDELGDPFVEPGPRPLPDLVGGDNGSEHRIQSSSPCDMRPPPPSQPSLPDGVQEAIASLLPSPAFPRDSGQRHKRREEEPGWPQPGIGRGLGKLLGRRSSLCRAQTGQSSE